MTSSSPPALPPPPPETDGWLEAAYAPAPKAPLFKLTPPRPGDGAMTQAERAARARANALLCHMSVLFGLPIFLMFLWRQRDPFLLHHAKSAGAIWLLFYVSLGLAIVVSPGFLALSCLLYGSSLVAIWRASVGRGAGWVGLGPVGEGVFFPFQRVRGALDSEQPLRRLPQEGQP